MSTPLGGMHASMHTNMHTSTHTVSLCTAHMHLTSNHTPSRPAPPQAKIIPESILQNCIKISNEPPSDMSSNMRRALAAFTPDLENRLSSPSKKTAFRSILFGLCFYHSLLLGRKKFGVGIGTGEVWRERALKECLAVQPGALPPCSADMSARLPLTKHRIQLTGLNFHGLHN